MDDDGIDILRIKKLIGTDRFHIDKNHESWTSSQTSFSWIGTQEAGQPL